jgi:hypothetical protein
MSKIIVASALLASTSLSAAASVGASATTSLWDHNGSVVYLVANGNRREFRYFAPRQGMLQAGAHAGSVLFSGRSVQRRYLGTAYVFNRQCGSTPYEVSGPILNDDRTVILAGLAPRLSADCSVYGYLEDRLEFTYLRSETFHPQPTPPQVVVPAQPPAPQPQIVVIPAPLAGPVQPPSPPVVVPSQTAPSVSAQTTNNNNITPNITINVPTACGRKQ